MEIALGPWEERFAPALAEYANNPNVFANLRDRFPHPYTEADAWDYIRLCKAEDGQAFLARAITVDGVCAGSITVTLGEDVYRRSGELGYFLGEPFWGKGIMTWAARAICREAFAKLDIVRIYAEPYAYNTGSRRVLEKAGFTLEGTLRRSVYKRGELFDSCIYGLLKEEMKP